MSEQNLYRTDRITPELTRAFLRLVGAGPEPAGIAATVVLLTNASAAAISLPDRIQITDPLGAVTFETREPVSLSPAKLVQVLAAGDPLRDVASDNTEPFDPAVDPTKGTFQPFGSAPGCGAALYLGFDRTLGVPGDKISLHI